MPDIILKRCPKCGADAEHDSRRYDGTGIANRNSVGHAIYCSTPCWDLPIVGGVPQFDTFEEAAEWWNNQPAANTAAA